LTLIGIAILVWLFSIKKSAKSSVSKNRMAWYAGLQVTAFVLFCAYMKWQPWNSRLHLPWFILWAPFVATAITSLRISWINQLLPVLLLVYALPWVLINQSKPLLPIPRSILEMDRLSLYFFNRPEFEQPYREAIRFLADAGANQRVGLVLNEDDWEYPLWALAKDDARTQGIVFEHIFLEPDRPEAALMARGSPAPHFIITTRYQDSTSFSIGETGYTLVWKAEPLSIFAER
jgi:hypothetical protein